MFAIKIPVSVVTAVMAGLQDNIDDFSKRGNQIDKEFKKPFARRRTIITGTRTDDFGST